MIPDINKSGCNKNLPVQKMDDKSNIFQKNEQLPKIPQNIFGRPYFLWGPQPIFKQNVSKILKIGCVALAARSAILPSPNSCGIAAARDNPGDGPNPTSPEPNRRTEK